MGVRMAGGCTAVSNCSSQRAHRCGGLRRRFGSAGASAGVGGLGGPPGAQLALARGSGGAGAWWSAVAAAAQSGCAAEQLGGGALGLGVAALGGRREARVPFVGRRLPWHAGLVWEGRRIPRRGSRQRGESVAPWRGRSFQAGPTGQRRSALGAAERGGRDVNAARSSERLGRFD